MARRNQGAIDVKIEEGCPQLEHYEAMDLIRELEESRSKNALRCFRFGKSHVEVNWLVRVVNECPIFESHAEPHQGPVGRHSGRGLGDSWKRWKTGGSGDPLVALGKAKGMT